MNRNQLWNSILQQAISGQLVEQLDSEPEVHQVGPAPASDEVPFELPPKWKWVPLEKICIYIQRGKSPKYSEIKQLPVVAQKCNQWDGLHMELALFIDPATIPSYKPERFLQHNDVLLNSTGTGTLGRVGVYDPAINPYEQAVADSHVTVIRADQRLVLPLFIKYVLSSSVFQAIIIDAGTGTTKQQELGLAKVKQLHIPLPPLEEQFRILARLKEIRPLVEKFGKVQEQLVKLETNFPRKLKASILQQAIRGELIPQLDSEPEVEQVGPAPKPDEVPFELPAKWKWVNFESVLDLISGRDLTLDQIHSDDGSSLTPYLTGASQIENGVVIVNRWTDAPVVISDKDDILLTCKGTVGKLAINTVGSMHIARQIMAIRCTSRLEPKFVLLFLQTYVSKLKVSAKGLIPGITRKDVLSLWVPLPPLGEQRRIVAELEEVFEGVKQLGSLMEYA